MKSGLEKYCNKRLTEEGFDFEYEGTSFEILPPFVYEGDYLSMTAKKPALVDKSGKIVRGIKYTPDFIIENHKVIIETKGYIRSNHSFPLRFKLFLSYLTTRGMGDWSIFLIKNQKQVDTAIEIIKNGGKKT
tara:strand:- start:20307 stop:20702 length:396 start_codon:yes stop_codon:yes gene_type:complete